jgi:hypothetical protein
MAGAKKQAQDGGNKHGEYVEKHIYKDPQTILLNDGEWEHFYG